MREKLQSSRGETLVEVLASILICALSIALLFGAVMASTRMDQTAQEADARYYQDLSKAERQRKDPPPGSESDVFTPPAGTAPAVKVENKSLPSPGELPPPPVTLGESDGLLFYGTERLLSYAVPPPTSGGGGGG